MTRKEFIKICGLLGIGLPFQSTVISCNNEDVPKSNFTGKVIIIGAGAGGLSAGYLLHQQGIDFEILEASSNYGGRMKINTSFADFPIPLGAEWLHTSPNILNEMVNDPMVDVNTTTINYNSQTDTYAHWENGQLNIEGLDDSDIKFVNSSWFNFYESYIVPSIADRIIYDTIVEAIDYSGNQVIIQAQSGSYTCDKVIVSVPLKILQNEEITFNPVLPQSKIDAINESEIWDGFKAFIEFSEKFYDTQIGFTVTPETDGQKLFYDAAYGQNSSKNILGLFTIGKPALEYSQLTLDELKDHILNELDEIYSNQATPNFIKLIVQNWNDEPFIKAGYLSDHADWRTVKKLGDPVSEKVYFSGGAYTDGEDWVSVHAAAKSAKKQLKKY